MTKKLKFQKISEIIIVKINLSLYKCSNASLTISINELETKEEEKTKRKIITEYQGQV